MYLVLFLKLFTIPHLPKYASPVFIDLKYASFDEQKSNGSSQGGATQRAAALAALSSALSPSPENKPVGATAPKPVNTGQGSQRAAALAALSSALTAEKTPDGSPARSARSPSPPGDNTPPGEFINLISFVILGRNVVQIALLGYIQIPSLQVF